MGRRLIFGLNASLPQIFTLFLHFSKWSMQKMLRNFEKSSNVAKPMKFNFYNCCSILFLTDLRYYPKSNYLCTRAITFPCIYQGSDRIILFSRFFIEAFMTLYMIIKNDYFYNSNPPHLKIGKAKSFNLRVSLHLQTTSIFSLSHHE